MELKWNKQANDLMLITPAIAAQWLQHRNSRNRSISTLGVDKMARDMAQGLWRRTHQGIAFDSNGVLIDGQHRLSAIVKSGRSVELYVATGLDPEVRSLVDSVPGRGVGAGFLLGGYAELIHPKLREKTSAAVWARMVVGGGGSKGSSSRAELIAFAQRHLVAGMWAMDQFAAHPYVRYLSTAYIIACVGRASYHIPTAQLERFVYVFLTGDKESPSERIITQIRDNVRKIQEGKNNNTAGVIYRKLSRAIWAYSRGEKLEKFIDPEAELFPLPEATNGELFTASTKNSRRALGVAARVPKQRTGRPSTSAVA